MVLVFFGPVGAALLMYFGGDQGWRPAGSVAHGMLVTQGRTLPTTPVELADGKLAGFTGHWSLLYVGPGTCAPGCQQGLYRTRQVRRALGKEEVRVQRFFIATGGIPDQKFLATEHRGLVLVGSDLPIQGAVLAALGTFREGDIFIADPRGNLVLRFPSGTSMKDLHQDLKLLLKTSQIG